MFDAARSTPRCPRCDSSDFEAIPTYDEDDDPTGVVAVVCARCGYHLEDAPAETVVRREAVAAGR